MDSSACTDILFLRLLLLVVFMSPLVAAGNFQPNTCGVQTINPVVMPHWMTEFEDVKLKSLQNITIPASHNSSTYRLQNFIFIRNFSCCQSASILEQLNMGIRFLDLRVEFKGSKRQAVLNHFFECMPLGEGLDEVVKYVKSKESKQDIVIMSIKGDPKPLNRENWQDVWELLKNRFEGMLVAQSELLEPIGSLQQKGRRVMVLVDDTNDLNNPNMITFRGNIVDSWSVTRSTDPDLLNIAAHKWVEEKKGPGFDFLKFEIELPVSIKRLRDSLKSAAKKSNLLLLGNLKGKWLSSKLNIVSHDFVQPAIIASLICKNLPQNKAVAPPA